MVGNLTSIEKLKDVIVAPGTTLGDISKIEETQYDNMISRFNGKDSLP